MSQVTTDKPQTTREERESLTNIRGLAALFGIYALVSLVLVANLLKDRFPGLDSKPQVFVACGSLALAVGALIFGIFTVSSALSSQVIEEVMWQPDAMRTYRRRLVWMTGATVGCAIAALVLVSFLG